MITKQDLKDWLAESERKAYEEKLEAFIDEKIKENTLQGRTTFYISTGQWGKTSSELTSFYEVWYTEELSENNREVVQERVLKKYREFGFDIEKTSVDCGWNNNYFALKFNNVHNLINDK